MTDPSPRDPAHQAEGDDAGRPRGRDEIDPELVRLPRKRPRATPVLALSVIALCVVMMVRLRSDLVFSRQADEPRAVELPSTATVDPDDEIELDRYVAVEARPEHRVTSIHVFPSRATDGHRLMPALGSRGALWLMIDGDPWDESDTVRERYVGRVRRLGDLPFFDALGPRLTAMGPAPVALDAAALRAALEQRTSGPVDPWGQPMVLAAGSSIEVSETVAGKALVTVPAIESHPDEQSWQAALTQAGVLPSGTGPVTGGDGSWTFEVPAPAGLDAVGAALIGAKLYAARAAPLMVAHRAAWAELGASPEGLSLGQRIVPWTSISAAVASIARPTPSPDAYVVVTTEAPGDYWYLLPLYVVFSLFVVLFAWGLVRAVREGRAEAAAASPG